MMPGAPHIGRWGATIALDPVDPYSDILTNSLRLTVVKAAREHSAGVDNSGYWGSPVQPHTRYRATLLARAEKGVAGPVTVSIVSDDGKTVYATGKFSGLSTNWSRFEGNLKTGRGSPTTKARFRTTLDQ